MVYGYDMWDTPENWSAHLNKTAAAYERETAALPDIGDSCVCAKTPPSEAVSTHSPQGRKEPETMNDVRGESEQRWDAARMTRMKEQQAASVMRSEDEQRWDIEDKELFDTVMVFRQGGRVRRCHTVPVVGHYDVAQHTYGMVSLLLALHPDPPIELVKVIMTHDLAESVLGDIPWPAKHSNPDLKLSYDAAEDRVLKRVLGEQYSSLVCELNLYQKRWLAALDMIELWLWSLEQIDLGNQYAKQIETRCVAVIQSLELPSACERFVQEVENAKRITSE